MVEEMEKKAEIVEFKGVRAVKPNYLARLNKTLKGIDSGGTKDE